MSEWRPIETAPRDGSFILVCDIKDRRMMTVVFWIDDESWPWARDDDGEFSPDSFTHWMPLPESPEC